MEKELFWDKGISTLRGDLLVTPSILKLLGNVKKKIILDLGCGDGTLTEQIAKRGAAVIGVDKNREILDLALDKKGTYVCKDMNKVSFNKRSFDDIYASMSFLYLNDKELDHMFGRIYLWLNETGTLTIADVHPTAEIQKMLPKLVHHRVPRTFDYFKTQKVTALLENLTGDAQECEYYHRSLSSYLNIAIKNKLVLTYLEEPKPTVALTKKYPKLLEKEVLNPSYVIFQFQKGK